MKKLSSSGAVGVEAPPGPRPRAHAHEFAPRPAHARLRPPGRCAVTPTMGFFDKAKSFMGGHGVKVQLTRIERQPASDAQMPIGDTVIKGNLEVTTEKPCTVLKHVFVFLCEWKDKEDMERSHELGRDAHDQSTDIIGGSLKWPYELASGTTAEDSFLISMDDDIPTQLRALGFANPAAAVISGEVKFKLKVIADVKGSPFDPASEQYVRIVP